VSKRDILLDAISEAGRLHQKCRSTARRNRGEVLMFSTRFFNFPFPIVRPLDKLLAHSCRDLPPHHRHNPAHLAVQRLQLHELGHFILGHAGSLDDESILNRSPFGGARITCRSRCRCICGELSNAKMVVRGACCTASWNAETFVDARAVYQLSLRAGASYEATVVRFNDIITS